LGSCYKATPITHYLTTVDRSKQHALLPKECVVITFPSFQNDIWRLDPRGNGSLKSVATVPGPAFKKEAPATMFDRNKILAIQGVQEAVVLNIAKIRTHRLLKRLVSFVKSAFAPHSLFPCLD
jgi:hypothetical protein